MNYQNFKNLKSNQNKTIISLLLFSLFSLFFIIFFNNVFPYIIKGYYLLISIIGVVSVFIGVLSIYLKMRKDYRLNEADFLQSLNNFFLKNSKLSDLYFDLMNGNKMTKNDIPRILEYIAFFEILSQFVASGVLSVKIINDLFVSRFFVALNNPFIKNEIFLKGDKKYHLMVIYSLYKKWIDYRLSHNLDIPFEKTALYKNNPYYDKY